MQSLKLSEDIQTRVQTLQDFSDSCRYISDNTVYKYLTVDISNELKALQIWPDFISRSDVRQIKAFVTHLEIKFFLGNFLTLI